jgi:hypothetical protein
VLGRQEVYVQEFVQWKAEGGKVSAGILAPDRRPAQLPPPAAPKPRLLLPPS